MPKYEKIARSPRKIRDELVTFIFPEKLVMTANKFCTDQLTQLLSPAKYGMSFAGNFWTLHPLVDVIATTGSAPSAKSWRQSMKIFTRGICLAVSCAALSVSGSPVFTTLHGFSVFPKGAQPETPLIQGRDGNFYGATLDAGTNGGFGTIFRLTTGGVATTLYTFSGGSDGAFPSGNLIQATDGNLYGTTQGGGDTNGDGTIFRITTNGAFTSLYQFTGGSDGGVPMSGLIQGTDGSLYGAAQSGGDVNLDGTIFKITIGGAFSVIYTFTGGSDGAGPTSALIQGVDGNLYGTAESGGDVNLDGTIFQITTNGAFALLYQFAGTPDGSGPTGALVQGVDGKLYGTTEFGGTNGFGSVFQLTTNIASSAYASLYAFTGGADGSRPAAGLIQDTNGLLYGTANSGGVNGQGTIFQITTSGAFTRMYPFAGGSDGANPKATLLHANDGLLYGSTTHGNTNDAGIIFRISTASAYAPFFFFPGINDGALPSADMILGKDGNYYGTTEGAGGVKDQVIFRATPAGVVTVLYTFGSITNSSGQPLDGDFVEGGLVQGSDGTLYGTSSDGGASAAGTIFSLTTNGVFTVLYSFTGTSDGSGPEGNLVFGKDGSLYGTTLGGGDTAGDGVIFQITTNGNFTVLFTLDAADGSPNGSLVQGSDGYLYGTAAGDTGFGTVFKVSTNANVTGDFSTLYSFSGGADGAFPEAGLALGTDGSFYGTTSGGGTLSDGTVFKIVPTTTNFIILTNFAGTNGSFCMAPLTLGKDGNFYGTTDGGGTNDNGTLFQVTPSGVLTRLWLFNGANDGSNPDNALISGGNGVFYGLAENTGPGGNGTFFRLDLTPYLQPLSKVGSTLNISWVAAPGLKYLLQYRTNLTTGNWVNIGGTNVATNSIMQATDTVGPDVRRFYRAALLP
jgi:uncharacterized repeat protein (TIGR03803 family)